MNKKKSVASVSSNRNSPFIVGTSDVIRWDDVMTVNGHDIKLSRAVTLGLVLNALFAKELEKDLKSKIGLLLTFPIARLMSDLQEKVGSGEKLLEIVKA